MASATGSWMTGKQLQLLADCIRWHTTKAIQAVATVAVFQEQPALPPRHVLSRFIRKLDQAVKHYQKHTRHYEQAHSPTEGFTAFS